MREPARDLPRCPVHGAVIWPGSKGCTQCQFTARRNSVAGVFPHGTYTGYNNHGCRCDECRQANTDWYRNQNWIKGRSRPRAEYLAARRAAPPQPHGTESRYSNPHRCRCALCRAAVADARKRRRHAAKVAA